MEFGLALWTLQTSALTPRPGAAAAAALIDDARLADALGYRTLWLSEHHFYYDGYLPSPLLAASAALAVTERLRLGTGVLLAPMRSLPRLKERVDAIVRRFDGRLDLGLGLGYRDAEFDGKGVPRGERGPRLDAAVDAIAPSQHDDGLRVWVAAQAERSVARAGRRGASIFLPGSMPLDMIADLVATHRSAWEEAGSPGGRRPLVGALRNAFVVEGVAERAAARDWVRASYETYRGLGYTVAASTNAGAVDFRAAADAALDANVTDAIVGEAGEVTERLAEVRDAGVDSVALRMNLEGAPSEALHLSMTRFAEHVAPALQEAA